jgi:tetratricopeptide (TPR) repeat protein
LEKAKSIAAENKADAIKIMDMVIEQFPDYIPALEFMAKLYVDDDNLAESLKYLSHIENLDPDYKINVENLSTKGIVKQLVI